MPKKKPVVFLEDMFRTRHCGCVPVLPESMWARYMRETWQKLKRASPAADRHFQQFMDSCTQSGWSRDEAIWAPRYAQGYVFECGKVERGLARLTIEEVRARSMAAFRRTCFLLALDKPERLIALLDDLQKALSSERILQWNDPKYGPDAIDGATAFWPPFECGHSHILMLSESYVAVTGPAYDMFMGFSEWLHERALLVPDEGGNVFTVFNRPVVEYQEYVCLNTRIAPHLIGVDSAQR